MLCQLCAFVGYAGVNARYHVAVYSYYKHLAISLTFQGKTAGILCVSFTGEVKVRH